MFLKSIDLLAIGSLLVLCSSCGVGIRYSMTGTSTTASTISVADFYNNADLGPANMGETFTNELKNYFVRNSSLKVVTQDAELALEGEITTFSLTPIAPVATGDPNAITSASSTRLTITVKATYINTIDDKMSFKDKTFSFYKDFPNELNISDIEDTYVRQVFERIINDIFNASVANW
ncbi:MAG TPA: LptE family protein [Chryseosolibacter sp.]